MTLNASLAGLLLQLLDASALITPEDEQRYRTAIESGELSDDLREELAKAFDREVAVLTAEEGNLKSALTAALAEQEEETRAEKDVGGSIVLALKNDLDAEEQNFVTTTNSMDRELATEIENIATEPEKADADAIRSMLKQKPQA